MDHVRVAVIGAGFSGIAAGVTLLREGIDDIAIIDRTDDVGGTWRDNVYPGCECDVPSHLYSLSFAPNPEWSRTFSGQAEIHQYLRGVAEAHGLRPYIRGGHDVREVRWTGDRWHIRTSGGELTAQSVISGAGFLSTPKMPEVPGLEDFTGVVMHTATWDPSVDLAGKRVAVVGTGASAIQVIPRIQAEASFVHVFQRTPPWVLPRRDRAITEFEKAVYRKYPLAQKAMRGLIYANREATWMPAFAYLPQMQNVPRAVARAYIRSQVKDPNLRTALTPDYQIGCKRVLLSNNYYKALVAPNAELIPSAVASIRANSVVAADGREREVDVIILATGFHVTDSPLPDWFVGKSGQRLSEKWNVEGMEAHRGTSFTDFPNLYFMLGPNTNLGHTSVVYMAESQLPYIMGSLRALADSGAVGVEPRPEIQRQYNVEIQNRLRRTVWNTGGCVSWYRDAQGRNPTLWPGASFEFRHALRQFDIREHELTFAKDTPSDITTGDHALQA